LKVGVVAKPGDKSISKILYIVITSLLEHGVEVLLDPIAAGYIQLESVKTFDILKDTPDIVIVVGGDGTLLRTIQLLGDRQPAIMTIRCGRKGFLLDVSPYEIRERIRDLIEGRYFIVRCMRLQAEIIDRGIKTPYALNEVTIVQPEFKVVRLHVLKDDDPIYSMDGDGIIIATPIGSTAYSLSAGGPIVDPEIEAIIITPINPLQLYLRSIIIPSSSKITVSVRSDSPTALLLVDGQYSIRVEPGETISVSKAPAPARIIRFQKVPMYEKVFERR